MDVLVLVEVVLGTVIGYCISFFKIRCFIIFFTLILLQSFHLRGRMQSLEKLCLKWNDFQENLISAFRGFRNDLDFTDVTLACEDGTQIEVHKFVLAATSPFFMEILKRNKHSHPLIYMRGLKAEALLAMIDFLYNGEANVNQDSLDDFLGLAGELKLKGLTKTEESDNQEYQSKPPTKGDFEQKYDHTKSNLNLNI